MDKAQNGIALQVVILGMALILILTVSVILFFIVYQRRLLRQQRMHQKIESDYQKDLLKAAIDGQEAERSRVAKELHDDIGAMLTTTKLYSGQLSSQLSPNELDAVAVKMNYLFDSMIQNTRRISQDLRPVILEKLGLIEGIENLVKTINDTKKIKVMFSQKTAMRFDHATGLNLYRILQELINNTLKHAGASEINIDLIKETENLILTYSDNGSGLDQDKLSTKKGIGLKNIESRVSILRGVMEFDEREKGMTLIIKTPFYQHDKE